MPYVDQEARVRLSKTFDPLTPGELNYLITMGLQAYITRRGGVNYALLNEVVGVLECVKAEFNRRVVAPYEDKKIAQNGDVYTAR